MKFTKSNKSQQSSQTSISRSETAMVFNEPLQTEMIERVRLTIKDVHVFKIPPRHSASGYRGADWKNKFWQGVIKIVERNEHCAILLVDTTTSNIFAVCPVFREGAVDRCIDSSRYFVLRVENADGRHLFIGIAFNERNDAFDFNATLEDIKRERKIAEQCKKMNEEGGIGGSILSSNVGKDYSIKEGQKIHVSIPKRSVDDDSPEKKSPTKIGFDVKSLMFGEKSNGKNKKKSSKKGGGAFLAPSSKDTPSRIVPSRT